MSMVSVVWYKGPSSNRWVELDEHGKCGLVQRSIIKQIGWTHTRTAVRTEEHRKRQGVSFNTLYDVGPSQWEAGSNILHQSNQNCWVTSTLRGLYNNTGRDKEMEASNKSRTDHFLVFSLGGGFRGIRNRALIGCMSHRATTVTTGTFAYQNAATDRHICISERCDRQAHLHTRSPPPYPMGSTYKPKLTPRLLGSTYKPKLTPRLLG